MEGIFRNCFARRWGGGCKTAPFLKIIKIMPET